MIATRFRSVYWVGGVAVAALGCYLVSQRVAAERASLARVETEIVSGERQIRALETEIGTRAGLNQIERWNTEVLSLSAPRAGQFMASEVQLASLVRPNVPAMEAPAAVQLASAAAPATPAPQVTRASYEAPAAAATPQRQASAGIVRASYTPPARIERKVEPERPARSERKAESAPPAQRERTARSETKVKPERTAKSEAKAKAKPERSARRDDKAKPERASRTAERKAADKAPRAQPAIYIKPKVKHQSMALLDDKLLGDLGRLARNERSGGKRDR